MPEALDANANAVLTMAEQKELQRKEKALAEMAALLVLQKRQPLFRIAISHR